MRQRVSVLCSLVLLMASAAASNDDGSRLLSVDHYVRLKSTAPAIAGQDALIYVREVVLASTVLRGGLAGDRVVLFVHGSGTPAEVAFDVPYKDYSWMAYLAKAGFDVFSMDMTGYGRSTRPSAMNDPCSLSKEQQAQFGPNLIAAPCAPSHAEPITTMSSDWNDIGPAVVHRGTCAAKLTPQSGTSPRLRKHSRVRGLFAVWRGSSTVQTFVSINC